MQRPKLRPGLDLLLKYGEFDVADSNRVISDEYDQELYRNDYDDEIDHNLEKVDFDALQ